MNGPGDFADAAAERTVLSAVINDPLGLRDAWGKLPADVWWHPQHQIIASAITELYARDLLAGARDDHERITTAAVKVTEAAMREAGTDGHQQAAQRLVANLVTDAVPSVLFARYAERLGYLARMRKLAEASLSLSQRLGERHYADDEASMAEAISDMRAVLDEVEQAQAADAEDDAPMPLADLLDSDRDYRWLIPGLFERRDRMILTGWEGAGKSELVHQIGVCVAGQVHPFTGYALAPREDGSPLRVMAVDCENSWSQLARRLRRHTRIVDRLREENGQGAFDWSHLTHRIALYPDGLELTKATDVARLSRAMDQAAPDLVLIGPLYKLTDADLNDGPASKAVLVALDRLRVRHDCVMLVEHHPGHATTGAKGTRSIRPAGSSNLMKWPEFGRGLMPADKSGQDYSRMLLAHWRADREQRVFPRELIRGSGRLPWTPADDEYFADADEWTATGVTW